MPVLLYVSRYFFSGYNDLFVSFLLLLLLIVNIKRLFFLIYIKCFWHKGLFVIEGYPFLWTIISSLKKC